MGALLNRFEVLGVRFDLLDGDRVRAYGTLTDELRAAIRTQKPALLTELAAANESTHFRWQLAIPGRDPFEVRVVPEPTIAQMHLLYPGATNEPLSDPPHRSPTRAEAAEPRSLIALILPDADDKDRAEALAVALADPRAALVSFRALAANLDPGAPTAVDDRRTCQQCTNLSPDGRCRAAGRGELPYVATRKYSPVPGLPKRCEGYLPRPNDADRRPGRERWPYLIAEPKIHPHSAGTAEPTLDECRLSQAG